MARQPARAARAGPSAALGAGHGCSHPARAARLAGGGGGAGGSGDAGRGRCVFGRGHGPDRRAQRNGQGHRLPDRTHQSRQQSLQSVLPAGRRAAGEIDGAGGLSGHLRRAAHRPRAEAAALLDRAAGAAGPRCLRAAGALGLALVWLGGGRLPGRVAQPRDAPAHEPRGHAPGVSRDRGQPSDQEPHSRAAAPDAPPQGEGRCLARRRGADQSYPLCRRAGF